MKRHGPSKALTPLGRANAGPESPKRQAAGACRVCLSELTGKQRDFCSSRCRLLSWAAKTLTAALEDGKADGLRDSLRMMLKNVEGARAIQFHGGDE